MTEFSHVSSTVLRRTLEREPSQLRPADIRQAIKRTIQALGNDVLDDEIPESVLSYRAEMAKEARDAVTRGKFGKAHSALRQFWLA
jgi:hypothetical protein